MINNALNLNSTKSSKGDVERKILWMIILLILLVIALAAFHNVILNIITKLFVEEVAK